MVFLRKAPSWADNRIPHLAFQQSIENAVSRAAEALLTEGVYSGCPARFLRAVRGSPARIKSPNVNPPKGSPAARF